MNWHELCSGLGYELLFLRWVQSQVWLHNDWVIFVLMYVVMLLSFRWTCRRNIR
jgi:hypothetical protein